MLTEAQVKAWLAASGLAVPPAELVRSRNGAVAAAAALGYPVVLKVQAAALPHKSDAGVLALGLRSDTEVAAAYDRLWARAQERTGLAGIDGVLVERMVDAGFEMLVGLTRHPALGPFLTIGAGGSQTEIFRDVAVLPAPATAQQVRAALARLRCAAAFMAGGPAGGGHARGGRAAGCHGILRPGRPDLGHRGRHPRPGRAGPQPGHRAPRRRRGRYRRRARGPALVALRPRRAAVPVRNRFDRRS